MLAEMKKTKMILFMISVMLTSFIVMWNTPLTIITNDLYEAFPDKAYIVTALVSWPLLITAMVSLLAGFLLSRISAKSELVLAGVLMLFGISAGWGSNIYWLTFCSVLMSIGAGFANTAAMALISEVFIDAEKRSRNIGYYNSFMALFGVIISYVVGTMAKQGWSRVFGINLFAIPMLLMTVLFLPRLKPVANKTEASVTDSNGFVQEKLGKDFWSFFVTSFIFLLGFVCYFVFISVYISENTLGDSALTGTATALFTAASIVAALCFSKLYARLGRKIAVIIYCVPIFLYLWGWLAPSKPYIIVSSTIYGICYVMILTMLYAYSADCVPKSLSGKAMGLVTFSSGASASLGVYVFSGIMNATGSITQTYVWAAAIVALSVIMELFFLVNKRTKIQ